MVYALVARQMRDADELVPLLVPHVVVIERRAYLLQLATRGEFRLRERLEEEFLGLPLVPYQPVRRQLLTILKAVNRRRRQAGLPKLGSSCIPKNRRLACVFAQDGCPVAEAA